MTIKKVIPLNIADAMSEVEQLNQFIDGLLQLADKIQQNKPQLQAVQENVRQIELNNNFYTLSEVAEALHCTTKTAKEELRKRGVEIIDAGKTYVVLKSNFIKAFEQVNKYGFE